MKFDNCDSKDNIKVCVASVESEDSAAITILKKVSNIVVTKNIPKYVYKTQLFSVDINIKNVDSDIPATRLSSYRKYL